MKIKFSWFICFAVFLPTLNTAQAQSIEYVDLIPKIEIQQSSSNRDSSVSWYDTFRFEARDSTWQSILYANILNNRRLQLANHRFDSMIAESFHIDNAAQGLISSPRFHTDRKLFIKMHGIESFPENLIKNVQDKRRDDIDKGITELLSSDFSNTAKKAYNKKSKWYLDGFSLINPNDPDLGCFICEPGGWSRENFDYSDLCYFVDSQLYSMDSAALFASCINEVFSPFFFKNTEVTNNEYRAFVDWVRDSVIWEHLRLIDSVAYCKENYAVNCPDSILVAVMPDFFNFDYPDWKKPKIFDNVKLQYNTGDTSIFIYPDTLCWINEFFASFNDPISRTYYSHPKYDNYPVVGISWDMANAYLSWLNQRFKSYYFDRNEGLEVIAKLPSITQWKQANSLQEKPSKGVYGVHWGNYAMPSVSNGALFNFLHLDLNVPDPLYRDNNIHELTIGHEHILGCLICLDGTLYPTSTIMEKHDIKYYKKHYPQYWLFNENNKISHTQGNVSEWMRHDFDTWNQHYSFFKYLLNNHYHDYNDYVMSEEARENYYPTNSLDPKILESEQAFLLATAQYQDDVLLNGLSNGKLLMGANWVDERHSTLDGIPLSGIYAKTFKSSDYTSSTVGFRYVLEVREIEVQ